MRLVGDKALCLKSAQRLTNGCTANRKALCQLSFSQATTRGESALFDRFQKELVGVGAARSALPVPYRPGSTKSSSLIPAREARAGDRLELSREAVRGGLQPSHDQATRT